LDYVRINDIRKNLNVHSERNSYVLSRKVERKSHVFFSREKYRRGLCRVRFSVEEVFEDPECVGENETGSSA
jgi:hypothetical protein